MGIITQTAVLLLSASWMLGCANLSDCIEGSGKFMAETRELPSFSGVNVSGSMDVYLTQGTTQAVKVEADDNLLKLIKTKVRGQELYIRSRKCYTTHKGVKVYITLPRLTRAAMSGSGDLKGRETFQVDNLDLSVSGSGSITLKITAADVNTHISGSGDIELRGQARDLNAHISGSGDLNARDLVARNGSLSVSGSGDCKVNVEGDLQAAVSGSGDVRYYGSPKSVDANVSGSGTVKRHAGF